MERERQKLRRAIAIMLALKLANGTIFQNNIGRNLSTVLCPGCNHQRAILSGSARPLKRAVWVTRTHDPMTRSQIKPRPTTHSDTELGNIVETSSQWMIPYRKTHFSAVRGSKPRYPTFITRQSAPIQCSCRVTQRLIKLMTIAIGGIQSRKSSQRKDKGVLQSLCLILADLSAR